MSRPSDAVTKAAALYRDALASTLRMQSLGLAAATAAARTEQERQQRLGALAQKAAQSETERQQRFGALAHKALQSEMERQQRFGALAKAAAQTELERQQRFGTLAQAAASAELERQQRFGALAQAAAESASRMLVSGSRLHDLVSALERHERARVSKLLGEPRRVTTSRAAKKGARGPRKRVHVPPRPISPLGDVPVVETHSDAERRLSDLVAVVADVVASEAAIKVETDHSVLARVATTAVMTAQDATPSELRKAREKTAGLAMLLQRAWDNSAPIITRLSAVARGRAVRVIARTLIVCANSGAAGLAYAVYSDAAGSREKATQVASIQTAIREQGAKSVPAPPLVRITRRPAVLRDGPSKTDMPITKLPVGTRLEQQTIKGTWVEVIVRNAAGKATRTGWVSVTSAPIDLDAVPSRLPARPVKK